METDKQKIKVSVIIPTFNNVSFLTRSVKSVLNQTYKNMEILVIDDGSKDNTEEIVERLKKKYSRIKYLKQAHKGVVVARNLGIKRKWLISDRLQQRSKFSSKR